MSDEVPEWKQFEIAVAEFLRALDQNAKVTHDAKIPDAHTGKPRQRDVWVEGNLCQLFPIKVLVSCKFTADRLNEQDIDAFNGEFIASRANKGVIYSKTGFTDAAIDKSKVLGFSCCRLYSNQPPDLPEALILSAYCSRNQAALILTERPDSLWGLTNWSDLFATPVLVGTKEEIALDAICALFKHFFEQSFDSTKILVGVPVPWSVEIALKHPTAPVAPLRIRLSGRWQTWVGKTEAYLLNGSYSITEGRFAGSMSTPVVDTWGVDPGPGWSPCDAPAQSPSNTCHFFIQGKTRESLIDVLGPMPLQIADEA